MKTKTEWWKVTKRGALIALSICCVAAVTGCWPDDDDDDHVPQQTAWRITITPDEGDPFTQDIPLPIVDLLTAPDDTITFEDGSTSIIFEKYGDYIYIYAEDSSTGEEFYLDGEIYGSTSMGGYFSVYVPSEGWFYGTWHAEKI